MALTSQQQAIQNKIDALDSATTSTSTLLSLLTQALDEGNIIWSYDCLFWMDSRNISYLNASEYGLQLDRAEK